MRFLSLFFLYFSYSCYAQESLLLPKSINNSISKVTVFCRDFSYPSAHRMYGTINPAMFNYLAIADSAYASELCVFDLPDSLISDLFLYPLQKNSIIKFNSESRGYEADLKTFDTAALIVIRSDTFFLPYFINISFSGEYRIDGMRTFSFPALTRFLASKCDCKRL